MSKLSQISKVIMISAFFAVFSSSYIDLFVPKAFAEDAAEEES